VIVGTTSEVAGEAAATGRRALALLAHRLIAIETAYVGLFVLPIVVAALPRLPRFLRRVPRSGGVAAVVAWWTGWRSRRGFDGSRRMSTSSVAHRPPRRDRFHRRWRSGPCLLVCGRGTTTDAAQVEYKCVLKSRLPVGGGQAAALADLLGGWAKEHPSPYIGPPLADLTDAESTSQTTVTVLLPACMTALAALHWRHGNDPGS
jgi:hypothetical protein